MASAQARLIFADRRAGSDRDQSAGNIDRLQLRPFGRSENGRREIGPRQSVRLASALDPRRPEPCFMPGNHSGSWSASAPVTMSRSSVVISSCR
jgi:hypothetical protein